MSALDMVQSVQGHLHDKEAMLLHDMAQGCAVIVEIGTFRGKSTTALALGAGRHGLVYTIDPHLSYTDGDGWGVFRPEDAAAARANWVRLGLENIRVINLRSAQAARVWEMPIDLVFVDGYHTYEACKEDFTLWAAHLAPHGKIALHDSYMESVDRVIGEAVLNGWRIMARADSTTVLQRGGAE